MLTLEDLERRALALPEEDRQTLIEKKEELCRQMFQLLKLKTIDEMWER